MSTGTQQSCPVVARRGPCVHALTQLVGTVLKRRLRLRSIETICREARLVRRFELSHFVGVSLVLALGEALSAHPLAWSLAVGLDSKRFSSELEARRHSRPSSEEFSSEQASSSEQAGLRHGTRPFLATRRPCPGHCQRKSRHRAAATTPHHSPRLRNTTNRCRRAAGLEVERQALVPSMAARRISKVQQDQRKTLARRQRPTPVSVPLPSTV
jgi:hypothetical protein